METSIKKAPYFTNRRITVFAFTLVLWFCMSYFLHGYSVIPSIIDAFIFTTLLEVFQFFNLRERFATYCKTSRKDEVRERIESLGYSQSKIKDNVTYFQKDNKTKWWIFKGKDTIRMTESPFYIKVESRESEMPYFEEFTKVASNETAKDF